MMQRLLWQGLIVGIATTALTLLGLVLSSLLAVLGDEAGSLATWRVAEVTGLVALLAEFLLLNLLALKTLGAKMEG